MEHLQEEFYIVRKIKLDILWLTETEKDMNKLQITGEYIDEPVSLRNKPKRTGGVWMDERKDKHQKIMKEVC